MVSAATSITTYLENAPEDVIIDVLPLSFDYGLYQMLMAFQVGATLVLERGLLPIPRAVLDRMVREGVTGFPAACPPSLPYSLQMKDLGRYDLSRLRYLTNTAARPARGRTSSAPAGGLSQRARSIPCTASPSASACRTCRRTELDRRPGSVGIPIPNTEVWVADEAGRAAAAGRGG